MKIKKTENEIKKAIELCQFKIDKRTDLNLTDLAINQLLGKRLGLELALEIIQNNK